MPGPRLMRQQGQRSVCTFLLIPAKSPRTAYALDPSPPVSLFSTDARSDAAVVGSANKARGKSSLLMS